MKQAIIDKIQDILANKSADEKELLFHLKGLLYETELQNQTVIESKSIADLIADNLTILKDETNHGKVLRTGYTDFDKDFGGFGLGELIVIGGRPSMGKTQLLVNLALHFSVTSPVLYFTFDLSEFLLSSRFLSSFTGIAVNKILQNTLTNVEKDKLALIGTKFHHHKIFVNDSCNSSITALRAHCKKQIQENGVKVIIVDYLQMMSSNKYRHHRELEISYISRELKNIAKDFDVCVIAASQLSRALETRGGSKYPQLSDLRESGAIEQDADKVIFIYRPEYYGIDGDEDGNSTAGVTNIILSKNRNGSLGTVKLLRDANFTNFRDFDVHKTHFSFATNRLDELEKPF
jgi:replicative DNA helicase